MISSQSKMGRTLSPIVRQELENLDKDADSRKSAMKALKSYVKDLDSKAIPVFLAHVSETKQTGIPSGEHTISLYEVLARVHGPKIVPQIDNIMDSIVKTLSLSAGAFALHQACSKVVPSIARYAIDPTTPEDKKRYIIHSLCKPLSDCLLGSQENLSSGSALCLQALVESDNWRFSSNEMINEVCQRVAGALAKHSQTNSHMALVTSLAKHNNLIVEAYARILVQSGLKILDDGFVEANSQKQLSAIHMLSSLMRCLDSRSLLSELEMVIKEMEKCQSDRMPFVIGAAFEALQIAKKLYAEKGSKLDNGRRRNAICGSGDRSSYTASPESQTVDSDYFIESPNSIMNRGYLDCRSVNRRLWQKCGNGILDVSLKDGIFSSISQGKNDDTPTSEYDDIIEGFSGFCSGDGVVGSNTPSPQRSNSYINVDDVKIFTTPRKLIWSLQDVDDFESEFSKKQQHRRYRSPTTSPFSSMREQNGPSQDKLFSGNEHNGRSESVSSTEDVIVSAEVVTGNEVQTQGVFVLKKNRSSVLRIVYGLFVAVFAVVLYLLAIGDQDDRNILVPT